MARITLEEIAQVLAKDNWKVISTDYQNLDTEMEFQCAEGHTVFAPWKKIRTKRECPVCKQNGFKENKPIIIEKNKKENRVLALDQATHNTGWAIFDGDQLIKYGIFETSTEKEIERFHQVKEWLISMIENWKPDIVGIEGIQYQKNFGVTTFQTLARLQGILMELCFEMRVPFEVCPTNTWRAHCGVKGQSRSDKKASMQRLIKDWFDISLSDDAADAIGIGKYVAETHKKRTEIVNWE